MSKELPYVYPANYYYQGLRKDLVYEGLEYEKVMSAQIRYDYRFEIYWETGETTEVYSRARPSGNFKRGENHVVGERSVVYPTAKGDIVLNKEYAIDVIKNLGEITKRRPRIVKVFKVKIREFYRVFKFSKGLGYPIDEASLRQETTIEEIRTQSNNLIKEVRYLKEVVDDLSEGGRIHKDVILEEKLEEELLYVLTQEFIEQKVETVEVIKEIVKEVKVIKEVIKEVEVVREVYPKSYYLYKHYYLEKDGSENVFYIGKGTGDAKGLASRIYNTTRNRYWDEIVEKHQGKIKCEVIEFFENEIECLNREKELQDYYWELGQCRGCADMHQRKKGLRFNAAG